MKIGWAYKRLNELEGEVLKFRKDAYTRIPKDDLDQLSHHVAIAQKGAPDAIGMLIGEFSYCLRSSLDNLAWQLALLTTDKPGRNTAFPIESECPGAGNRRYNEKVANIPPKALSVIESLQPYHSWPAFKNHPLWQLNKLCNIDKHRSVALGYIEFVIGVFGVSQAWKIRRYFPERRDNNCAVGRKIQA